MPDQRSIKVQAPIEAPLQPDSIALAADRLGMSEASCELLDQRLLKQLEAAALSDDRDDFFLLVSRAIDEGTTAEAMVDHYIPEVAREMGKRWCEDTLGFARVTIGTSRLQSALRDIEDTYYKDLHLDRNAASVMLIVSQDVYHTLGAMVLASQLRRNGLSVKLVLGECLEVLAEHLRHSSYQAVFISSSCGETLESLSKIVDVVTTSVDDRPPVVIGGTILDVEPTGNVAALTGADYATKILSEALEFCGLTRTPLGQLHMTRGQ